LECFDRWKKKKRSSGKNRESVGQSRKVAKKKNVNQIIKVRQHKDKWGVECQDKWRGKNGGLGRGQWKKNPGNRTHLGVTYCGVNKRKKTRKRKSRN